MGKRKKEHRKRVQKRNERIKQVTTSFQKKLQQIMDLKLEQLKELEKENITEETKQEENNNQ